MTSKFELCKVIYRPELDDYDYKDFGPVGLSLSEAIEYIKDVIPESEQYQILISEYEDDYYVDSKYFEELKEVIE